MKQFDFNKIVERRGSGALKYDGLQERYGNPDLLPMWVADMDFETPPFIVEALKRRLDHPIFGYAMEPKEYWPTVKEWIASHHNWNVKEEWLTYIPGIVKGIGFAINVFVEKGEKVIIQPPVYHHFRMSVIDNGREVAENPLKENPDGSYSMDFENLESITDSKCRMLVLSNPHNPAGILWDRETLVKLADFCYSHNIIVISDEIHCDMALWGKKHIPFATVSEKAAACSITFGAPSKTFNMAGIVSSYAVVPNDTLRNRFYGWLTANELNDPPVFAPIATIAAFKEGEEWRKQMLHYIEENINFVIEYCAANMPKIKPLKPDASFLVWLDCRDLGLSHEALIDLIENKAHIAMNDGAMFGVGGAGLMRMNVGTPRSVLKQALEQIRNALNGINNL